MRRIKRMAGLGALMALTACGTPQQQCIANATAEVRKLDRMIAEVSGNLGRGYAIEEQTIVTHDWAPCGFGGYRGMRGPGWRGAPPDMDMCLEPDQEVIRRNVPIDPAVQSRMLQNLQARRAALVRPVDAAINQCRVTYPE